MGLFSDLLDIANNEYEPKRKRRNYDDDEEIRVVGVRSVNADNTDNRPIRIGVWNADDED